jgi:hypothetical protein
MNNTWVEVELEADKLAEQIAGWTNEDILEFIKKIDEHKGEWDLISLLKPWVDGEHRKMIQEETEDKARREGKCQRDPHNLGIWVHVSPHRGCILR